MTLILLRPDITIPQNENKKKRIFCVLARTHRLQITQSGVAKLKSFLYLYLFYDNIPPIIPDPAHKIIVVNKCIPS